jgi:GNAT superfamily N-acetyltransferase
MIEVREARRRDLAAIAMLLNQLKEVTTLHRPIEQDAVIRSYEAMLRTPELYSNLLAVENDRVVGLVSIVLYRTFLHAGGTALINELVIAEDARGRGIGGKLIEAAISAARKQGMDEVEVGTEKDNAAARDFYGNAGFDREYVLLGMELDR